MNKITTNATIFLMILGAALVLPEIARADCHEDEPPCDVWWNVVPKSEGLWYFPGVQEYDGSAYIVDRDNRIWYCRDNTCQPVHLTDSIK